MQTKPVHSVITPTNRYFLSKLPCWVFGSTRMLLSIALFSGFFSISPAFAASPCGGDGQRACCDGLGEGQACQSGTIKECGCSGDCTCGGFNPFGIQSIDHCVAPKCGNDGQRGCCTGAERAIVGISGPCKSGLKEDLVSGCSGNCNCLGSCGGIKASGMCYLPTPCGGAGQRACCIGTLEYSTDGDSCNPGTVEAPGCSGNCKCGGGSATGQSSSGTCVAPACGGVGQRGCCVGAERAAKGLSGPCQSGLIEDVASGCTNCKCTDSALSSSGICKQPTACGGAGQRACCNGLSEFSTDGDACNPGLVQAPGCTGDCLCGGPTATGQKSSGTCVAPVCGGEGQRGCCLGAERQAKGLSGPCQAGLIEDVVSGCSNCKCTDSGLSSSGICKKPTTCGGAGQRACCNGLGEFSTDGDACNPGTVQAPGCTGNCLCGGTTATGQLSGGMCVVPTCGGEGQRGCCTGAERQAKGLSGPCAAGLIEDVVSGCSNCKCTDSALSSSGICKKPPPCGGAGQRACCNGLAEFSTDGDACNPGLVQAPGCSGNCLCGGIATGQLSSGTCVAPVCGAEGQRGCCIGAERQAKGLSGPCQAGLVEDTASGCSGSCKCADSNLNSSGICKKPTPCGAAGQRACCSGTLEYAQGQATCNSGLVEVPGCAGDCLCGGPTAAGAVASGTCIQPTPCGGKGQRACCVGFLEYAGNGKPCNNGLIEIPGCAGDCFCGGSTATGGLSSGMCTVLETIPEPTTGWTAASTTHMCPLRGYMDMHLHLHADMAHGGGIFAGKPYHATGGINAALQQCYGSDANLEAKDGGTLPSTSDGVAPDCPSFMSSCGEHLFHGDHTIFDDPGGAGTKDGSKSNYGAPIFNGWPQWTSTSHQQAYWVWLERAWRGGMRLVTMLAVTNEALCAGNKRIKGTECDDSMAAIDAQLTEAFKFEAFIDNQYGGPGLGWYRIVTTPQQARQVIAQGKMAVVLGIEVDNIFNCKYGQCNAEYIDAKLDEYYQKGVRHIFPVHNFDNGFGGSASWQDAINVGNKYSEGHWWETEDCSDEGFGFKLDWFIEGLILLLGFGDIDPPAPYTEAASCNTKGLSPLGIHLINGLMDRGYIIDVDHMSRKSLDQTLDIAEQRNYPLVVSHVQYFDLNKSDQRHERMRTQQDLIRIRNVGGMIATMLKDDVSDTDKKGEKVNLPYGKVEDTCRHSSRYWAQAYQYSVATMNGPVAFGSDFNGFGGHLAPRFGHDACGGDPKERSHQLRFTSRLTYPFTLDHFGTFAKQVTGHRTFDYNTDGLAHVGLLPDLVADLKVIGLNDADLNPLWMSASGYIDVWEKGEGSYVIPPTAVCKSITVNADATCKGTGWVGVGAPESDLRVKTIQSPAGPYSLGTTNVGLTVTQVCGNGSTTLCNASVTVVDKTGPTLTCQNNMSALCTGPKTLVKTVSPTASDNCSTPTVQSCTIPTGGFPVGNTHVVCTAQDAAGNSGTCAYDVFVDDQNNPTITAPPNLSTAECGGAVDLGSPTVADLCDPAPLVSNNAPAVFPPGTTTVKWTVVDLAGNSASANQLVTTVDNSGPEILTLTPSPAVLWPADGTMKGVTLAVSAQDACDPAPPSCEVTNIVSDESDDGIPGPNHMITGPLQVQLRAERDSDGDGRTYTLTVECSDSLGNTTTGNTTVTVPILNPEGPKCWSLPGDVNGDGVLSVVDTQCGILLALWDAGNKQQAVPSCAKDGDPARGDMDCDGVPLVTDILFIINYVLKAPLNPELDPDGDGCPIGCESDCIGNPDLCEDDNPCTLETCSDDGECLYDDLLTQDCPGVAKANNFALVQSNLSMVGSASVVGTTLRMTPDIGGLSGGAWWKSKLPVTEGFDVSFMFQFHSPFSMGADGMAFVIQNTSTALAGDENGLLGGTPQLALGFDSYQNPGEPSAAIVRLWLNGQLLHLMNLGGDFTNSGIHSVVFSYKNGLLSASLNGTTLLFKNIAANLGTAGITDADGKAWIGFTARTGGVSENHDVLSLSYIGACQHEVCDDNNPCTIDSCQPQQGCAHFPGGCN